MELREFHGAFSNTDVDIQTGKYRDCLPEGRDMGERTRAARADRMIRKDESSQG